MKLLRLFIFVLFIGLPSLSGIAQEENIFFLHTVKAGQTLYSIASMYNVSVDQVTKLNPGANEMIFTGEVLRIPQQKKSTVSPLFHTIKTGETLYKLSQTYKVSVKEICDLNPGLNAENFHSGEVIRIPSVPSNTKEVPQTKTTDTNTATLQKTEKEVQTPIIEKYKEMHKVKRSETVYSICKKYKISEEELLAANPTIKTQGLQKGDMLYIPYPAPPKPVEKIPTDKELFETNRTIAKKTGSIKLAVMLPFKEDSRMVEYYEGMLLAIDTLKRSGISMDVYAYDTSSKNIDVLLKEKSELANMDIIFGPRDKALIKPMSEFARRHQIKLVIPFTSKDNEVFSNPFIYMINTPQLFMYSTVYSHLLKQFSNPNVVFIENSVGDKSKEQFISGLKDFLLRSGVTYTTVGDGASVENMAETLFNGRTNIFIPTSGTHVEMIKILTKMELLKRNNRSMAICLFGYPEWQTMTKEHLKQFFAVSTYFYTSFYTNSLLPEARRFDKEYHNTYRKVMEDRYPKYGMLGYDTGFYFLKGIAKCGSRFDEDINRLPFNPVQTGFLMKRVNNWGGFINQKVFFIHYATNSEVERNDFD